MKRKTIIKKLLAYVLVILVIIGSVPMMSASAETETITGTTDEGLVYEITNGEVTITGYEDEASEISIPETIKGYPVTIIGGGAFYRCDSQNIFLPDSITRIGDGAFRGCSNLLGVTIPENVTYIGDNAFRECSSVEYVTMPNGVDFIGKEAFMSCGNLQSINIPEGATSIGGCAFYNCGKLQNITIPDSVTTVGAQAFDRTAYYEDENNWENGVLYINSVLISAKETLSGSYTIKEGTKVIANYAFLNCENLENINIPQSTTNITLSNSYVVIMYQSGEGGAYFGSGLFTGCSKLKEINVDENNEMFTSVGGVLIDKTTSTLVRYPAGKDNTEYTVPDGVASVGYGAFLGCDNIKSVVISEGVTSIADFSFYGCDSLQSITIPESVTSISGLAFYGHSVTVVFGYAGSTAEIYAKENGIKFIAIKEYTDADSEITVEVATDDEIELNVTEITDTDLIGEIDEVLADQVVDKLYDITLTQGDGVIQPEGAVTVKIPTDNENATVYRVEEDNTLTDMNAVYKDGYMMFTTDHFSLYVLAVEKNQNNTGETVTTEPSVTTTVTIPTTTPHETMVLLGDADNSEKVNVKDATLIQKAVAGLCELSARDTFAANVISTDVLNVKDATAIQKWVASIEISVSINEYVPYNEDEHTPSDPEETTAVITDDVAVISCGGETFNAKVGDTVTYTVLLSAQEKFENIQGNICFDSTVISPITEGAEDAKEFARAHCPNLTDAVVNQDSDDSVVFNASEGYTGFNFKSEKLLVTYSFVVLSAEETEIDLSIDTMTIFGGDSYYFDEGVAIVTDGIEIREAISVS